MVANRLGLDARSLATLIYFSRLCPTHSGWPSVLRMLRPPRPTGRSPASVITGTPIHNASKVVVPPANGNGSRAMSISW